MSRTPTPPPGTLHEAALASLMGMKSGGNIRPKLEAWGIFPAWVRLYHGKLKQKRGQHYYSAADCLKAVRLRNAERQRGLPTFLGSRKGSN